MKKSFKIILIISVALNLIFIGLQVYWHYEMKKITFVRPLEPRTVDAILTKKNFRDSLYMSHPSLKTKKYIFINFWNTGHYWSTRTLPIYDTIIQPLRNDVGYLLVNNEKDEYSRKVLKQDSAETKNYLYMFHSDDFIHAINQELKFKPSRYWYPKYPLNIILDNNWNIVFFDTVGIAGPKFPEDSVDDRKTIARIKLALKNLK